MCVISDYAGVIQDVIAGLYNNSAQYERYSAWDVKRQAKLDNVQLKLASMDLSTTREATFERRLSRLQTRIASVLSKMDFSGKSSDAVVLAINSKCIGNASCDDHGNVPEPSTIALLGMGLVGIGVARRLRKKAR